MDPLQPGDPTRIGTYTVLARLGAGGMGVVYLARSAGGRTVAVKIIRESLAADPEYAARFAREVAAARRVTGTFTAPVLDADPAARPTWLVTAFLPGLSLADAVRRFGPVPPDAVRALAVGLAEALVAIHRAGVVHRDLKPENVMLTAGGPRVIDFGIARPSDSPAITSTGVSLGTPGFMAPEQIAAGEVGPASDVFALGAVLVFAATGTGPFGDGSTRSKLSRTQDAVAEPAGITEPWLRDLVGTCLRPRPGQRPTARDLLHRLGRGGVSLHGTRWLPAAVAEAV
ncbi:MAG: serine/threonine-protein kinase, partial [Actinocatenispora sp.]